MDFIEIEGAQARAAFATGLTRGDRDALARYLADFEVIAPGLAAAAIGYVLDGGGDAPARLAARAVRPSWDALYPLQDAKAEAARRLFLAPEGWDAPAIRRLGEIVAAYLAVTGQTAQIPGTPATPGFIRALAQASDRCLRAPMPPPAAAWLLTGARCLELLALEGADQAALADMLFATPSQNRWGGEAPRALLAMSGLGEALAADPSRALAGVRALDGRARLRFIAFLGRAGIAGRPGFLAFLVEAAAGGKSGAEAARAALGDLPRAGDPRADSGLAAVATDRGAHRRGGNSRAPRHARGASAARGPCAGRDGAPGEAGARGTPGVDAGLCGFGRRPRRWP